MIEKATKATNQAKPHELIIRRSARGFAQKRLSWALGVRPPGVGDYRLAERILDQARGTRPKTTSDAPPPHYEMDCGSITVTRV